MLRGNGVAILAPTAHLARTMVQDFQIQNGLTLSPRTVLDGSARGATLNVLLVHDDCWPMTREMWDELAPALKSGLGYVWHLERIDPKKGVPVARRRMMV